MASAPGKVILLGEHFVVYGGQAIAVAIDKGVIAEASIDQKNSIMLIDSKLQLESSQEKNFLEPVSLALDHFMKEYSLRGIRLVLKSNIPSSAGLGSSAASSVAAIAAAAELFGIRLSDSELYDHAIIAEQLVHKRPSGLDVFVSISGGAVKIKQGKRFRVDDFPSFQLMVCDSKVKRNTGSMVEKVSEFKNQNGDVFKALQTAVDSLVGMVESIRRRSQLALLANAMNLNHEALRIIGASTPLLDKMVIEARSAGYNGAKLTGAGGGGCIIALAISQPKAAFKKFSAIYDNAFLANVSTRGVHSWKE
ncbi:MAG: mevalonate kinase [Conexivisphaerales archaeon]